ncbi:MAG TPA: hypothetical protein VLR92_05675 [Blastocatellia bacterium]|nr:hypothetical protein [Blastocatellia bacterium]
MKMCRPMLAAFLSVSLVSCVDARTRQAGNSSQIAGASSFLGVFAEPAGRGSEPASPAVFLDTAFPQTAGRTISVGGSGEAAARDFQAALESAKPGDVIALQAGATFTGNFTLPRKEGLGWIIIRSAAKDDKLPPAGSRITPAFGPVMPKLVSPNADGVISTAPGAHHFRFVGVEFTTAPGWAKNHGLILLGDGSDNQRSADAVPHDLIIDRCYIHGNPTVDLRRAIALNSASTAVIDSYISEVHEGGADSQAICGWNGPGPFKIVNNYLEAAGENVMFGGADPHIPNLVPSDIEFRRNHCSKSLSWMPQHPSYAGKHWSVKNLFELKNARRIVVDKNVFENNWVDGQSGFAILFTVRNQEGTAPWSVVEDALFSNNVVRHSAAGVSFLGRDNNSQSEQVKRVLIRNNLFDDIGSKQWGNNGRFLQIAETIDVVVDHNTVLNTGNIIAAYGQPNRGFVFTNNIVPHNEYVVIGDGAGIRNATLDKYFPGCVFKKNVISGGRSSAYPADNYFPAAVDEARFTDAGRGNYILAPSSPYKSAATDGKSIGCDIAALKAAFDAAQSPRDSINAPLQN